MIVGWDLFQRFGANIDFKKRHVKFLKNIFEENKIIGAVTEEREIITPTLNNRVRQFHIADSDMNEEQTHRLINLVNKYEKYFANNLN